MNPNPAPAHPHEHPHERSHDNTPVVMVAYQCAPGMGSVSQLGWQWFLGMGTRRPVTLVTHVRNRAAIESAPQYPDVLRAGSEVVYIDTEWFAARLYRLAKKIFRRGEHAVFVLAQLDWFVFDACAVRRVRALMHTRNTQGQAPYALIHLVTPVTVSAFTRLHRLGLPVIRGPLNCGLKSPAGFTEFVQGDGTGLSRLRALPNVLERLVGSLRRSARILVATQATQRAVPRTAQAQCRFMLENAIDPHAFTPAPVPPLPSAQTPLRVCCVARLVPVKALPLLLHAMHNLVQQGRAITLDVVGDGPMRTAWEQLAHDLQLSHLIRWHGHAPHSTVEQVLHQSHVFCLPSVRESGGGVLLEAMACARAVIALDHGGPAELVHEAVGWKIPLHDPAQVVHDLSAVLHDIVQNPHELVQRGQNAHQWVTQHHTWPSRWEHMQQHYQSVLP